MFRACLVIALAFSSAYAKQEYNTDVDVISRVALIYFINSAYSSSFSFLIHLLIDRYQMF